MIGLAYFINCAIVGTEMMMASNTETYVHKWNYCFLCQTNHKGLELSCPASSRKMKNNKQGILDMYIPQVENLIELSKLDKLPQRLQVDDLITTTGAFESCYDEVENKHDIPRIVNIMAQIPTVCWHKHPCRSSTDSRVVQKEKRRREINTPDFSKSSEEETEKELGWQEP